jgi:hypothetical protein
VALMVVSRALNNNTAELREVRDLGLGQGRLTASDAVGPGNGPMAW